AARSVERLHRAGLILRTRHGGRAGRNSYQPNWEHSRAIDEQWQARLRAAKLARERTGLSPATGQPCQVSGDSPVTQTCNRNLSNKPVLRGAAVQAPSRSSSQTARPMALERKTRARP